MNIKSIHVRLTLWYTLLIVGTSLAFGAYTYASLRSHLYEEMNTTLTRRVEHIRDDILPKFSGGDPETLKRQIEQIYSPEQSNRFIRITKTNGPVIYMSGTPQDRGFDPQSIPAPTNQAGRICKRTIEPAANEHLLIVGCGAVANNAEYVIEMGAPLTEIDGILRRLVLTLLIGLPVVASIAIAGGSFLVRRALQPVEAMRATAEQISFGNVRQRLPVMVTGDAVELLSKTLNQMLERLDQVYQQASRFSADASHELRTPLAIMRSELETLLQGREMPDALRERIGSILEEIERLSHIVEALFSLARLDAGEAKASHDVCDLAALAQSTLEQMHLMADEKKLSVLIDAPQPVFVMGDPARLKQVIVNLLDNAIKYTMSGGSISVSVRAVTARAVLTFKDNGIGISSDALPHIFERFYQAGKIRSRAAEGAGLGLSIVHSICQAHGGDVTATSREGTGTTLTVELPLANDATSGTGERVCC